MKTRIEKAHVPRIALKVVFNLRFSRKNQLNFFRSFVETSTICQNRMAQVENRNKTGKMIATKEGERTSKGASDLVGDSLRGI